MGFMFIMHILGGTIMLPLLCTIAYLAVGVAFSAWLVGLTGVSVKESHERMGFALLAAIWPLMMLIVFLIGVYHFFKRGGKAANEWVEDNAPKKDE